MVAASADDDDTYEKLLPAGVPPWVPSSRTALGAEATHGLLPGEGGSSDERVSSVNTAHAAEQAGEGGVAPAFLRRLVWCGC